MTWYDTDATVSLNSAYTWTTGPCHKALVLRLYNTVYICNLLYTILFSQTETSFQKGWENR
jgi:hypothetical protein